MQKVRHPECSGPHTNHTADRYAQWLLLIFDLSN